MPFDSKEKKLSYQREYRKKFGRKREYLSALDRGNIEMVDGEAIDGKYVLLGSANHGHIFRETGLTTVECLEFLLSMGKEAEKRRGYRNSDSIKVIAFSFDYDVNMILHDLSQEKIQHLSFFGWCLYHEYKIEYWDRKRFMVTKRHCRADSCRTKVKSVVIDDIFTLFGNKSFISVLTDYHVPVPDSDMEKIIKGKEERKIFKIEEKEEIIEYNRLECVYGIELVKIFRKFMKEAGFTTTDLYSPACLALENFRKNSVGNYMDKTLDWKSEDSMKRKISRASYMAFFGGRIEAVKYGKSKGESIQNYDINSAYPFAQSLLPNLSKGHWKYENACKTKTVDSHSELKRKGKPVELFNPDIPFSLYHVRFNFTEERVIYPFPFRTNTGRIFFPKCGQGWYWSPEVRTAIEDGQFPKRDIEILEAYYFIEDNPADKPFAYINNLYSKRLEFKAENNKAEKVMKLCLNSGYGKFAQEVGARKGNRPTYHQIEFAGYITSYTRAELYHTVRINHAEPSLIAFTTDGIYTTQKLSVDEGEGLGQWKHIEYAGIELVQSGVYRLFTEKDYDTDIIELRKWIDDVREKIAKIKSDDSFLEDRIMIEELNRQIDEFENELEKLITESEKRIVNDDMLSHFSYNEIRNLANWWSYDKDQWTYLGRGYMDKAVDWKTIEEGWKTGKKTVTFEVRDQFIRNKYAVRTDWKTRGTWMKKKREMQICADNTKRSDIIPSRNWTAQDNPTLHLFPTTANSEFMSKFGMSGDRKPAFYHERKFSDYIKTGKQIEETELVDVMEDEDFFIEAQLNVEPEY